MFVGSIQQTSFMICVQKIKYMQKVRQINRSPSVRLGVSMWAPFIENSARNFIEFLKEELHHDGKEAS